MEVDASDGVMGNTMTTTRCDTNSCEELENDGDSSRFSGVTDGSTISTADYVSIPSLEKRLTSEQMYDGLLGLDKPMSSVTSDLLFTTAQDGKPVLEQEQSESELSDEIIPFVKPAPRKSTYHRALNVHVIDPDLSKGQELYPIRVWNAQDKESIAAFEYIKNTEHFTNYQKTAVICDCEDGCEGSSCKCLGEPYEENHSEPAYNEDGRLKDVPDSWVEKHRVLYECSEFCKCGPQCLTRSAQLGLRTQLEVFKTSRKGWGVRSLRNVQKGSFIVEYAGVMTESKDYAVFAESDWYSFDITSEDGPTNFFIDASKKGNVARFINHGCDPNLLAVHVFYDDNNPVMGMHICLYATRDIKEKEELTFDYGSEYWLAKMNKGIGCECGHKKCMYRLAKSKKEKRKKRRYQ
ncbi:hypothetical protein RvY_09886 [Ramazzottius varieornatus]|uniref:SET domain-containing protein n=1 Tax=Ramazzottius varieornatus TaxID=947166 RepID=A0A1D1VAX3_RAMVA|nr:hypothetical protein RvY_09886 [Ramazzottius varieornatus]